MLKMPDMMFYLGTFTAVPSVLYCFFSVCALLGVFKGGVDASIKAISFVALPLFTFFCNISMLYFGRINRKNHRSSYWDWTALCYSILILIDIVLIFTAFASSGGNGILVERPVLVSISLFINIFISMVLVQLPSALECGCCKRYFLCVGMLCYCLSIMLIWIISTVILVQICRNDAVANALFSTFPYRMLLNSKVPHLYYWLTSLAGLLFVVGYISHLVIVTHVEGFGISRAFNRYVVFFICVPVFIYVTSFASSFVLKNKYSNINNSLHIPLSVENLRFLYYNGEQPDELFWEKFVKEAALLKSENKDASYKVISSMLDKRTAMPKCNRDLSKFLKGDSPDLQAVFTYTECLRESMCLAIEKKDASGAMAIARRAIKIDVLLMGDVYAVCGIRHVFISEEILFPFMKSGLATTENRKEMQDAIIAIEKSIDSYFSNVNYWHTLCSRELFEILAKQNKIAMESDVEMPVLSMRAFRCLFPQQYCFFFIDELNERRMALSGGNNVMAKIRDDAVKACRNIIDYKL